MKQLATNSSVNAKHAIDYTARIRKDLNLFLATLRDSSEEAFSSLEARFVYTGATTNVWL